MKGTRMKADSVKIANVFSGGGYIHYVLPHFQREYTWEKTQWQTLLADAAAIYDEMGPPGTANTTDLEHFLGSLVVINDGTMNVTVPVYKLVDGQQRLTTISLLLCALSRVLTDTHSLLRKKIIRNLINEDESGDLHFKLLPTTKYGDRAAYTAILRGETPNNQGSRVWQAYKHLYTDLAARVASGNLDPERLFAVIMNSFQVVFITLDSSESPYKIFESLNAKGKSLSQADLVRNYIAMRLPGAMQEQVFTKHWAHIEDALQEQRLVGKSGLGELTAFLRHYLAMRTGVLCSVEHVYARFRDRAEREFPNADAFAQEIAELHRFAGYYNHLLRPAQETSAALREPMTRLNTLEASTAYPFLLSLYDAHDAQVLTGAELVEALAILENYLVRRFLAGEATNFLNKVFPTLWGQLDMAEPMASLRTALAARNYPSDGKLRQVLAVRSLYDKSALTRERTALVLDAINRRLSVGTGGYTALDNTSTIEHVLPQTLSDLWRDELGSDWERVYGDRLNTLGNLTLVTQEWNSSLSNAPFAVKRSKLAAHALLMNSAYFGQDIPAWDEGAIKKRGDYLTDKVLEVWPSLSPSPTAQAPKTQTADFYRDCVHRIAQHLGLSFVKQGSYYATRDGASRLVCAVSKAYPKPNRTGYWFAFHPAQSAFLSAVPNAFIAYGCGSAERVLLFPIADFLPLVQNMSTTTKNANSYWHVLVDEIGANFYLTQALLGTKVDVSAYLLKPVNMK